jgi:hypothetical protein
MVLMVLCPDSHVVIYITATNITASKQKYSWGSFVQSEENSWHFVFSAWWKNKIPLVWRKNNLSHDTPLPKPSTDSKQVNFPIPYHS